MISDAYLTIPGEYSHFGSISWPDPSFFLQISNVATIIAIQVKSDPSPNSFPGQILKNILSILKTLHRMERSSPTSKSEDYSSRIWFCRTTVLTKKALRFENKRIVIICRVMSYFPAELVSQIFSLFDNHIDQMLAKTTAPFGI